jgi:hypothetical protein
MQCIKYLLAITVLANEKFFKFYLLFQKDKYRVFRMSNCTSNSDLPLLIHRIERKVEISLHF